MNETIFISNGIIQNIRKLAPLCTQSRFPKVSFEDEESVLGITQDWKWDFFHNSSMHPLFDSRDDGGCLSKGSFGTFSKPENIIRT